MELTASVLAAPQTPTDEARVLVVLPSLGTSVGALWQQAATQLAQLSPESTVIGIDLPGHVRSAPIDVPAESTVAPRMTVRELAEAVDTGDEPRALDLLARIMAEAASRLHGPGEGVEAQVLKGRDHGGAADDQWSRLREGTH